MKIQRTLLAAAAALPLAAIPLIPGVAVSGPAPARALTCPDVLGDFDGSGTCGVGDLVVFNKYWNAGDARADMNGDCAVDVADVSMIYNYYYPLGDATIVDFNLNGTAGDDSGDFLAAWLVGNPRCNVDGDCDVDNDDLVLWFDWVYAGCP